MFRTSIYNLSSIPGNLSNSLEINHDKGFISIYIVCTGCIIFQDSVISLNGFKLQMTHWFAYSVDLFGIADSSKKCQHIICQDFKDSTI